MASIPLKQDLHYISLYLGTGHYLWRGGGDRSLKWGGGVENILRFKEYMGMYIARCRVGRRNFFSACRVGRENIFHKKSFDSDPLVINNDRSLILGEPFIYHMGILLTWAEEEVCYQEGLKNFELNFNPHLAAPGKLQPPLSRRPRKGQLNIPLSQLLENFNSPAGFYKPLASPPFLQGLSGLNV